MMLIDTSNSKKPFYKAIVDNDEPCSNVNRANITNKKRENSGFNDQRKKQSGNRGKIIYFFHITPSLITRRICV